MGSVLLSSVLDTALQSRLTGVIAVKREGDWPSLHVLIYMSSFTLD